LGVCHQPKHTPPRFFLAASTLAFTRYNSGVRAFGAGLFCAAA
jgi:hypothetical protein